MTATKARFGSIAAVQPRPCLGSLTARKKETASHRNLSKPLCQGTSLRCPTGKRRVRHRGLELRENRWQTRTPDQSERPARHLG